jgi:hypothetical protein
MFNSDDIQIMYFYFIPCALLNSKKYIVKPEIMKTCSLGFSSNSSVFIAFTYRALTHVELGLIDSVL